MRQETGNITEEARRLFLSQPSLTSAIQELEKEMGVRIFNRTNKGVIVSHEGDVFLSYARQVLEQVGLLEERFLQIKEPRPCFGVSCQHYSFAVNAFVDVIQEFDACRYDFTLRETQTHEIIEDVSRLKSEVGILYISTKNKEVILKLIKQNNLCFEEFNSFYFAEEILSTLDRRKNIKVRDRATLFNLVIGLHGYTVSSGIISRELNGENIIARPLVVEEEMIIGTITQKNMSLSRYGKAYMEALKRHLNAEC
ncbi:MAG: LysR family transcriptional regulator [Lachnospiraceae bacterium]